MCLGILYAYPLFFSSVLSSMIFHNRVLNNGIKLTCRLPNVCIGAKRTRSLQNSVHKTSARKCKEKKSLKSLCRMVSCHFRKEFFQPLVCTKKGKSLQVDENAKISGVCFFRYFLLHGQKLFDLLQGGLRSVFCTKSNFCSRSRFSRSVS